MIQPYLLIAESELHAGAGKVEGKAIDNPIQREKGTRFPKVEGSGYRGALKANFRRKKADWSTVEELFGKDPETDENQIMGLLKLDVASLLLMPVYSPSSALTYYITSPFVLRRWIRNLNNYGLAINIGNLKSDLEEDECLTFNDSELFKGHTALIAEYALKSLNHGDSPLPAPQINGKALNHFLSEILYPKVLEGAIDINADLREITQKRIVIAPDLLFSHMVQYKTAVHVGNSIDPNTGVVKEGALFSVEYLPQGSVLSTTAHTLEPMQGKNYSKISSATEAMTVFDKLMDESNHFFSLGGKSSIGKGHIKMEKFTISPQENDND